MNLQWLLTTEKEKELTADGKNEYLCQLLYSNGIFSPYTALGFVIFFRFPKYPLMDCPHCGNVAKHYILRKEVDGMLFRQYKCKRPGCRIKFSMYTGTWLENNKLDDYHIVRFAYLVGAMHIYNSSQLARDMGVTQVTSWHLLDVLRTAIKKRKEPQKFKTGGEVFSGLTFEGAMQVLLSIRK